MGFIDDVKNVPIEDFAGRMGFSVVQLGKYYSLREHDSVRIDPDRNAFWRNSKFQRGEKGAAGSVIDFAMEICGYDRKGAIREIARMYNIQSDPTDNTPRPAPRKPPVAPAPERSREPKILNLPPKAENNKIAFRYLCGVRKLEADVVRWFMKKGHLYQDDHNNCVFKTENFACLRSTGGKKFAIDVSGCDYDECFFIRPNDKANTLVVAESVIDIMSIMSQMAKEHLWFTHYSYLALAGVSKLPALFTHLSKDKRFDSVVLAMDNDESGQHASRIAELGLMEKGFNGRCVVAAAPCGKDWNEYLQMQHDSESVDAVLAPILNRL